MKTKAAKPPKGYRITLSAGGNAIYFLTIKCNGRLVPAPTELRGMWEDCRKEAIAMCERHAANPMYYDHIR